MKRIRFIGWIMAFVMIIGILPVGVFAEGGEQTLTTPAANDGRFTVEICGGVITVESGICYDGRAAENTILSVDLDANAFPGAVFDFWKSADGTKITTETFRLCVTKNTWIYPVFKDLTGNFGQWSLVYDGNCEEGKTWRREDPATGLVEYKTVYENGGMHDFEYRYIDDDTCAQVCRLCGYTITGEHEWSSAETIVEATHEHTGLERCTCWRCGHTSDIVVPISSEHTWDADAYGGDWEIIEEAKDGQPGIRRRHCLYCDAYEDYWYIRAEWEKYYFGNKLWFDTDDSVGLWGTDDELHYNFINDEGYDTYVYAVRQDYRDNYQSYAFMWIDHADALGRKPLYLAKSKGHDDNGYYRYTAFDWAIVGYLDSVEDFISEIDHITCGYDRYSSSFFDYAVKYENFFNQAMIPINEEPSLVEHCDWWIYNTEDGAYGTRKHYETGITCVPIKYDDGRYYLSYDPKTNVCLYFWEPNASSHSGRIRGLQALVRPDEYAEILADFVPDGPYFPTIEYPPVTDMGEGHEHTYDLWSNDWLPVDDTNHVTFCLECGAPVYWSHSYSNVIDIDLDDMKASTKRRECSCGYFTDMELNVMSTDNISAEIKSVFQKISSITSFTVDVSHTPTPKNFQMRVNPFYYVDGPYAEPDSSAPYDNRFRWYGSSAPWEYGYEITDWFSFGIVRTETTPAGYANYSGGNTFYVKLPYTEVANYAFDGWEIYDWATQSWVFFSNETQPEFNKVSWEGDYHDPATAFTSDTRLTDMTLLRCRLAYTGPAWPADPANVTVIGGTCYADGGYSSAASTGSFAPGTMVYFEQDYEQVPAGKRFEGWRIEKDGALLEECSYAYGVTLESGDYIFTAVYENELYNVSFGAENGCVYLAQSGTAGDTPEEYYGGEYEAGTQIVVTTVGEAEYPYFYGWFFYAWKEDGAEPEILSTDLIFTYTVEGRVEGSIVAVWGETEVMPDNTHALTAVNGFAALTGMHVGIYVDHLRVPNGRGVSVMPDPSLGWDMESWVMTSQSDAEFRVEGDVYSFGMTDFWIEDYMPALLTVTGTGVPHTHTPERIEAAAPTCTEEGNIAYFYCEGCDKCFADAECASLLDADDVFLPALGHTFGNWNDASDGARHTRVCTRCGYTESERHAPSDWIDCGAEGHCMYCTVCMAYYATLMHRYTSEITVQPTPQSKGEITYTCALCGHSYTEELPELADAPLPQDLNGDGGVNITDVTTLLGILSTGGSPAALIGDLNNNQETDIGDVTMLLNYLASN